MWIRLSTAQDSRGEGIVENKTDARCKALTPMPGTEQVVAGGRDSYQLRWQKTAWVLTSVGTTASLIRLTAVSVTGRCSQPPAD